MMQLEMLLNVFSLLVSISEFFLKIPFQQLRSWILTIQRGVKPYCFETCRKILPVSLHLDPTFSTKIVERGATSQLLVKWRQLGDSWTCWFRVEMCCHWIHGRGLPERVSLCLGMRREDSGRMQGMGSCLLESSGPTWQALDLKCCLHKLWAY